MDITYSIKDLENLTGIKAHTIRIWEQRYNLLNPQRTDTNIRYYLDSDLRKILNINLLYTNGLKISKIAKLSDEEIVTEAEKILQSNKGSTKNDIEAVINKILDMDSEGIHNLLEQQFQQIGIIRMYLEVVNPLLIRIGELWQLGTITVAHEHLFSNTLREFVLSKTNNLPYPTKGKKIILFLHEQEEHELTLLFYQYLLKDKGWECIYLGQNVPMQDFENAYYQLSPHTVLTSMITNISSKKFRHILNQILDIVPEKELCISGQNTIVYKDLIPPQVNVINKLNDFSEIFS